MDNIWQVALALICVIALIVVLGYVARRVQAGKGANGGLLRVVDSAFLGPKERLVLIRVRDQDVLIAMNAQCITKLGEFPATDSFAGALHAAAKGRDQQGAKEAS